MRIELTENEFAALTLLKSTGVPTLEAAQLACAAIKAGRGKVKRALRCIAAGAETLKQQERTVTFEKAVAAALEARRERRVRTVYDFRYFTRRFMKRCPGLARRKVRAISAQECAQYIEMAFDTPRQCRVRHCGEAGLVQREPGGSGRGSAGGGEAGADSFAAGD